MLVVADCSFMSSLNLGSRYKRKQSKRGMEGGWTEEVGALWCCGCGEGGRRCRGGVVGVGWWGQIIPLTIVVSAECCFTSTENIMTIRGQEAQHGHLDLHTTPELCRKFKFGVAFRPHRL